MRAWPGPALLALLALSAPVAPGTTEPVCDLPDLARTGFRLEQVTPEFGPRAVATLGPDAFFHGSGAADKLGNPAAAVACPLHNHPGSELMFAIEGAQAGVPYLFWAWADIAPFCCGWFHEFARSIVTPERDGPLEARMPFQPWAPVPPGVVDLGEPLLWHAVVMVYRGGQEPGTVAMEQVVFVPLPRTA